MAVIALLKSHSNRNKMCAIVAPESNLERIIVLYLNGPVHEIQHFFGILMRLDVRDDRHKRFCVYRPQRDFGLT